MQSLLGTNPAVGWELESANERKILDNAIAIGQKNSNDRVTSVSPSPL
jgi:hypothetical protein